MQDMSKDGLIPAFDMDTKKCQTCMLNKITKKPFQNVKRETEVLELIHSDLCDLHATPSLGNTKYFVTFIDDASRFYYVYLLHSKDEALYKFKVFKTEVELQQRSLIKRFKTDKGGLGQGFWGEAMITAFYLLNRVPNKRNMITPYELCTKKKPNPNYLKVWGCRTVVRLPDPKLKTLGKRGIECIFVGYAEQSKAFRFYVIKPNDLVSINFIIESRDAIFDEHKLLYVPKPSQKSLVKGTEDSGGSVVSERVTDEIVADLWVVNGSKRKLKVDETVEKFKARLVIQGFIQKSWIDYFDTYAPVALISTIRLLIAMASIHNQIIHQIDVKTAFLNRELEEEVYMNQPLRFILPGNENKVCKLIKSLYGLKQWHQKFHEVVSSNGYLLNQADKCVYSKFDASSKGVIIFLYVDDMLIFGTDQVQVDLSKEFLSSRFSIKDMGEADVILGIRIKHKSNGIAISQSRYIEKVLKKFNYSNYTPVSTPLDTCEKLMPNRGLVMSQLEYSRVIGCLMYVMTCTRPDIAFIMGKLSRYTSNPRTQHWQAIQKVLKYLKKNMDYRLMYSGYPLVVEDHTDASWISNTEDNSSTSGWVFLFGGGAISWASKKQTCITRFTMESEFVALAAAGKEVLLHQQRLIARCTMGPRHLGVRHSMIRELITNGVVSKEFVRSQQNLVDHLTNGLARELVIKSAEGMGLKDLFIPVSEDGGDLYDPVWIKLVITRYRFGPVYELATQSSLVSWKSKKHVTLSKSSSKAEYKSMSSTSCKILWLGNLLHSLGLKGLYLVELNCNNSSAIQIAANIVFHERIKHFELDIYFVREKVMAGIIKTVKVHTNLRVTDIFTKCLGVVQHNLFCKKLGLLDIFVGVTVGKDKERIQSKKKMVTISD
ncbi:zinc finger, CCHC-type containing protein [Tanacetum coccineum]